MKISGSRPVSGASSVSRKGAQPARSKATTGVSPPRAIQDTTSIMGIPQAEFTPKVRDAIMTLMGEVDRLRRELDTAVSRLVDLERLADEDPLAPVANRRAFVRELSRVMSFSERYGAPAALLFFDANQFKQINDKYGHAAGDQALRYIAKVLVSNVRDSDIVGRLGGDEFGVILAQADEATAHEKAQLLVQTLEKSPLQWEGHSIPVSMAYGVYALQPGENAGDALAKVDKAMYANKSAGRSESKG